MVALPLLDMVLAAGEMPERSATVASQLTRSAVADLEQIERLDDSLAPQEPSQAFDREAAALLRGMYVNWTEDAERLLDRIDQIERQSGPLPEAEALRHAYGRTRARLAVSLDDIEQGLRDAHEGRTVPSQEVRRELRLRVQQAGTHAVSGARTMDRRGNT